MISNEEPDIFIEDFLWEPNNAGDESCKMDDKKWEMPSDRNTVRKSCGSCNLTMDSLDNGDNDLSVCEDPLSTDFICSDVMDFSHNEDYAKISREPRVFICDNDANTCLIDTACDYYEKDENISNSFDEMDVTTMISNKGAVTPIKHTATDRLTSRSKAGGNRFLNGKSSRSKAVSNRIPNGKSSCSKAGGNRFLSGKSSRSKAGGNGFLKGKISCSKACGDGLFNDDALKEGKQEHANKLYSCKLCSKSYVWRRSLRKHHVQVHLNKTLLPCEGCMMRFRDEASLENHKKSFHRRTFKCNVCGKIYYWERSLRRHMQVHRKHALIVDSDEEFPCHICAKSFHRKDSLRRHLREAHQLSKHHTCEICHKDFQKAQSLKEHMKTHKVLDDVVYICENEPSNDALHSDSVYGDPVSLHEDCVDNAPDDLVNVNNFDVRNFQHFPVIVNEYHIDDFDGDSAYAKDCSNDTICGDPNVLSNDSSSVDDGFRIFIENVVSLHDDEDSISEPFDSVDEAKLNEKSMNRDGDEKPKHPDGDEHHEKPKHPDGDEHNEKPKHPDGDEHNEKSMNHDGDEHNELPKHPDGDEHNEKPKHPDGEEHNEKPKHPDGDELNEKSKNLNEDELKSKNTDEDELNGNSKNPSGDELHEKSKNSDGDELYGKSKNSNGDVAPLPENAVRNDLSLCDDKSALGELLKQKCFEKSYSCPFCDQRFSLQQSLNKHQAQDHPNDFQYRCELCRKNFRTKNSLRCHMETHHNKQYECNICGKIFVWEETLQSHMTDDHKDDHSFKAEEQNVASGAYECHICNKRYQKRYSLKRHISKAHKASCLNCKICAKEFQNTEALKDHMEEHMITDDSGIIKYSCSYCTLTYSRLQCLIDHMEKHYEVGAFCVECGEDCKCLKSQRNCKLAPAEIESKARLCEVCGVVIASRRKFVYHLKSHRGENQKEFKCPDCSKCFTSNYWLNIHKRKHTGEKPFLCSICGKGFAEKRILAGHIQTHTGCKECKCNICGKEFAYANYLTVHMRSHTNERPYWCKVCSKDFTQKSSLNLHMKTHEDHKKYSCQYCGKSFSIQHYLTSHLRTHTGEKPFICSVCEKGFSQKSSLNTHMRSCH